MRSALVGLVAALVVACGAFSGTDSDPAPAASADAGTDGASPSADGSRPAVSVTCAGLPACGGDTPACCVTGTTGAPNACAAAGKCPEAAPHPFLCDDASDCFGAGFPEGTLCCATLRADGAVLLGSSCVSGRTCPASTLELCQPGSPTTSTCTRATACLPNTSKVPTLYAYCQ